MLSRVAGRFREPIHRSLSLVLLGLAGALLASCDSGDDTGADVASPPAAEAPAAAAQAPPVAAVPAAPAISPTLRVGTDHAILFGDWAPDQIGCATGDVIRLTATQFASPRTPERSCSVLAVERDGDVITVAGTCSSIVGVATGVTFALAAEVINGQPPGQMDVIQGGTANDGREFTQAAQLVRCPSAPAAP